MTEARLPALGGGVRPGAQKWSRVPGLESILELGSAPIQPEATWPNDLGFAALVCILLLLYERCFSRSVIGENAGATRGLKER